MKLKNKKILLTGGDGFLGRYIIDNLINKRKLSSKNIFVPRHADCDLRRWANCQKAVLGKEIIIHLAAKVGGTDFQLNHPAEIFYDNLIMGAQLLEAARQAGVQKFVFIGSVNSYPANLQPPFQEKYLWNGPVDEISAAYGFSKKILLIQAETYHQQYGLEAIYLILTNLYGSPLKVLEKENSNAIPIFVKRIKEAQKSGKKSVINWGTGKTKREFLHAADAAELILLATEKYNSSAPLNLGPGYKITINDLAQKIAYLLNFNGEIKWDGDVNKNQADRFLNCTIAQKLFKFKPKMDFDKGLKQMINHYESQN